MDGNLWYCVFHKYNESLKGAFHPQQILTQGLLRTRYCPWEQNAVSLKSPYEAKSQSIQGAAVRVTWLELHCEHHILTPLVPAETLPSCSIGGKSPLVAGNVRLGGARDIGRGLGLTSHLVVITLLLLWQIGGLRYFKNIHFNLLALSGSFFF